MHILIMVFILFGTIVMSSCAEKKVVLFGDSIVEQGFLIDELCNITDFNIVNAGKSGTTIARRDSCSFVSRINKVPRSEYMVIMGGNNDYIFDMEIGDIDDATYPDTTLYRALHRIIQYRMKTNPECLIVLCTPLHCAFSMKGYKSSYDACVKDNRIVYPTTKQGYKLVDYVNAIRRIAEFYSIPVCDFYSSSNICPFVPENNKYNTQDGIHPQNKGAERMARLLKTYLYD